MADKTCFPDPVLLAHLDDELSASESHSVALHLSRCGDCQVRQNELQLLAQAYANTVEADHVLPAQRVEAARQRFLDEVERNRRAKRRRLISLAAALAACFLIGLIALWHRGRPQNASDTLLLARTYEQRSITLPRESVHQVFSIQIKQNRPVQKTHASTLDIFSDAANNRASLRWQDDRDHLRYAVWRPNAGAAYVYDSESTQPAVVETSSHKLTEASGTYIADLTTVSASVETMDLAVEHWIRQSNSQPLLLTEAFQVFCENNHVVPKVTRGARIALFAEKQVDGRSVRIELLLNKATHKPVLERVICSDGTRTVELVVSVKELEVVPSDSPKTRTWFYPTSLLPRKAVPVAATHPPHAISRSSGRVHIPDQKTLDDLQVRTLYALHQIRACLGDPISVERHPEAIIVSGLLDSTERKSEIIEALVGLSGTGHLQIRLRTVAEAVAGKGEAPQDAQAAAPMSQLTVRMKTAALDSVLMQLFANAGSPATAASKRTELGNEALAQSATLLAHTWALRHLSESFSERPPESPESQILIQRMAQDHRNQIASISTALEQQFAPVFQAESIGDSNAQANFAENDPGQPVLQLFAKVTDVDRCLRLLLSGPNRLGEDQVRDSLRQLRAGLEGLSLDAHRSTARAPVAKK